MKISDLVSVIIPSFNRAKYLDRTIKSVLVQVDSPDLEVIVVDDGSKDNTLDIVQEISRSDSRVRYICHNVNLGAQAARNTGIKAADGNWIAFLDSDDVWLPRSLHARLSLAYKLNVSVVHSECYVLRYPSTKPTLFGVPSLEGRVYAELLRTPGPVFPALLAKKTALEQIGYLDESIISYQEWDTSIQLSKFFEFGFLSKPTFIYNCHDGDTISKSYLIEAQGYEQIILKHLSKIQEIVGRKILSHHYAKISRLYNRAGKQIPSRRYMLKAAFYDPVGCLIRYFKGFWYSVAKSL